MKYYFSIFLIFVMTANLTVSLVKHLRGADIYEPTEMGTDDADEKSKTEKEKESFTYAHHHAIQFDAFDLKKQKRPLIFTNDDLISQCYASLPELPPEV